MRWVAWIQSLYAVSSKFVAENSRLPNPELRPAGFSQWPKWGQVRSLGNRLISRRCAPEKCRSADERCDHFLFVLPFPDVDKNVDAAAGFCGFRMGDSCQYFLLVVVLTSSENALLRLGVVAKMSAPHALPDVGEVISPRRASSAATKYTPLMPVPIGHAGRGGSLCTYNQKSSCPS
jgi:hypothetical protein